MYDINDIKAISLYDAIRKRPTMYVGALDGRGLRYLVNELFSYSIQNSATEIIFSIHKDKSIAFTDNSNGVNLQAEINEISAQQQPINLGLLPINVLSEYFDISTAYKGIKYRYDYKAGVLQSDKGVCQIKSGIHIRFKPDRAIFTTDDYDSKLLLKEIRKYAYLNKNLKIKFKCEDKGIYEEIYYPNGISDFLKLSVKNPVGDIAHLRGKYTFDDYLAIFNSGKYKLITHPLGFANNHTDYLCIFDEIDKLRAISNSISIYLHEEYCKIQAEPNKNITVNGEFFYIYLKEFIMEYVYRNDCIINFYYENEMITYKTPFYKNLFITPPGICFYNNRCDYLLGNMVSVCNNYLINSPHELLTLKVTIWERGYSLSLLNYKDFKELSSKGFYDYNFMIFEIYSFIKYNPTVTIIIDNQITSVKNAFTIDNIDGLIFEQPACGAIAIDIAYQYSKDHAGLFLKSFVNGEETDNGSHVQGFFSGLKSVGKSIKNLNYIISMNIPTPAYEGATKQNLAVREAYVIMLEFIKRHLLAQ